MMSILDDIRQHIFTHASAIVAIAALTFSDQLRLRVILLVSIALNIFDHTMATGGPSWDDLFWNIVTLLTDLWVIVTLILDRTHVGLNEEQQRLFAAFGSLSPGEFREIVKLGTWRTADRHTVLTEEGVVPRSLFYVLEGRIDLAKSGRFSTLDARTFIGEVAFLRERTASATVSIATGARYLEWSTDALQRHFVKRQDLRVAVTRLLSADMALKVARA